jgi:hypothetical protein
MKHVFLRWVRDPKIESRKKKLECFTLKCCVFGHWAWLVEVLCFWSLGLAC